ncbi:unnamed protein product [Notodromas monacha]|uniref:Chitin-binding type-2 domain-containing protein n=1 Tax=Notodromas monacha TaxID=399045 RepID=A0A7R9BJI9_9CRUS|nr:unnamed protein product [Notodromas monacha]CAG0915908.1 unnamed protein product [Notodromas monacha]
MKVSIFFALLIVVLIPGQAPAASTSNPSSSQQPFLASHIISEHGMIAQEHFPSSNNNSSMLSSNPTRGRMIMRTKRNAMLRSGEFPCYAPGFYPKPGSCTQFVRCVDFHNTGRHYTVFTFSCGPGTVFDERIIGCNHPWAVPGLNCAPHELAALGMTPKGGGHQQQQQQPQRRTHPQQQAPSGTRRAQQPKGYNNNKRPQPAPAGRRGPPAQRRLQQPVPVRPQQPQRPVPGRSLGQAQVVGKKPAHPSRNAARPPAKAAPPKRPLPKATPRQGPPPPGKYPAQPRVAPKKPPPKATPRQGPAQGKYPAQPQVAPKRPPPPGPAPGKSPAQPQVAPKRPPPKSTPLQGPAPGKPPAQPRVAPKKPPAKATPVKPKAAPKAAAAPQKAKKTPAQPRQPQPKPAAKKSPRPITPTSGKKPAPAVAPAGKKKPNGKPKPAQQQKKKPAPKASPPVSRAQLGKPKPKPQAPKPVSKQVPQRLEPPHGETGGTPGNMNIKPHITCTAPGFYPNPGSCTKFYRCVDWNNDGSNFGFFQFTCGPGTMFNDELDTCTHPTSDAMTACPASEMDSLFPQPEPEPSISSSGAGGGTSAGVAPVEPVASDTPVEIPDEQSTEGNIIPVVETSPTPVPTIILSTETYATEPAYGPGEEVGIPPGQQPAPLSTEGNVTVEYPLPCEEPGVYPVPGTEGNVTVEYPLPCEEPGVYPVPGSCNKFYHCSFDSGNAPVVAAFECPPGEAFDQAGLSCTGHTDNLNTNKCPYDELETIFGDDPAQGVTQEAQLGDTGTTEPPLVHTEAPSWSADEQQVAPSDVPVEQPWSSGQETPIAEPVHQPQQQQPCQSAGGKPVCSQEGFFPYPASFDCPAGTMFDDSLDVCNHLWAVTCPKEECAEEQAVPPSDSATVDCAQPVTDATLCKYPGFFRTPGTCNKFYRCWSVGSSYQIAHFDCPAGTVFDENLSVCNHIWAVSCNEQTVHQEVCSGVPQQISGFPDDSISAPLEPSPVEPEIPTQAPVVPSSPATEATPLPQASDDPSVTASEPAEISPTESSAPASEATETTDSATASEPQSTEENATDSSASEAPSESSPASEETSETAADDTSATPESTSEVPSSSEPSSSDATSETSSTEESSPVSEATDTPSSTASPLELNCESEGYFPVEGSCKKFYRCVDLTGEGKEFKPFIFVCGPKTAYDPNLNVCVHPETLQPPQECPEDGIAVQPDPSTGMADELEAGVAPPVECTEEGFFRNPAQCNEFYRCVNTNSAFSAYSFTCGPGTVFDDTLDVCVREEDVQPPCGSESSTPVSSSGSDQATSEASSTESSQASSEASSEDQTSEQSSVPTDVTEASSEATSDSSSPATESSSPSSIDASESDATSDSSSPATEASSPSSSDTSESDATSDASSPATEASSPSSSDTSESDATSDTSSPATEASSPSSKSDASSPATEASSPSSESDASSPVTEASSPSSDTSESDATSDSSSPPTEASSPSSSETSESDATSDQSSSPTEASSPLSSEPTESDATSDSSSLPTESSSPSSDTSESDATSDSSSSPTEASSPSSSEPTESDATSDSSSLPTESSSPSSDTSESDATSDSSSPATDASESTSVESSASTPATDSSDASSEPSSDETSEPSTTAQPMVMFSLKCGSGNKQQHPVHCNRFYECNFNGWDISLVVSQCDPDTVFDEENQECVPELDLRGGVKKNGCTIATGPPPAARRKRRNIESSDHAHGFIFNSFFITEGKPIYCNKPGLFSLEGDCNAFYRCQNHSNAVVEIQEQLYPRGEIWRCPEGTSFHEEVQQCMKPQVPSCVDDNKLSLVYIEYNPTELQNAPVAHWANFQS